MFPRAFDAWPVLVSAVRGVRHRRPQPRGQKNDGVTSRASTDGRPRRNVSLSGHDTGGRLSQSRRSACFITAAGGVSRPAHSFGANCHGRRAGHDFVRMPDVRKTKWRHRGDERRNRRRYTRTGSIVRPMKTKKHVSTFSGIFRRVPFQPSILFHCPDSIVA